MILQIVSLEGDLSEDRVREIAEEFAPRFHTLQGLIQKHYVRGESAGRYAGVFLWRSSDDLAQFRGSDLALEIEAAYQLTEPPRIELYEVLATVSGQGESAR